MRETAGRFPLLIALACCREEKRSDNHLEDCWLLLLLASNNTFSGTLDHHHTNNNNNYNKRQQANQPATLNGPRRKDMVFLMGRDCVCVCEAANNTTTSLIRSAQTPFPDGDRGDSGTITPFHLLLFFQFIRESVSLLLYCQFLQSGLSRLLSSFFRLTVRCIP